MSHPNPFDATTLADADEQTLELHRRLLVLELDERRELVIDHLMVRAMPVVARETVRRAAEAGLSRETTMLAGEEAAITLLMRLHTPAPLPVVTTLARTVVTLAVEARAGAGAADGSESADAGPPARRRHLRAIDGGRRS
jgi:hypothetical protein